MAEQSVDQIVAQSLTPSQIAAISGPSNIDPGEFVRQPSTGEGVLNAIKHARGTGAVNLPTDPINARANMAIDITSGITEQLLQAGDNTVKATAVETVKRDDAYSNIKAGIAAGAEAKTVMLSEQDLLEEQRRAVKLKWQVGSQGLLDQITTALLPAHQESIVSNLKLQEVENDNSAFGMIRRFVMEDSYRWDAEQARERVNNLISQQNAIIGTSNQLAERELAVHPTKTTALKAAEAALVHVEAGKQAADADLKASVNREDYFTKAFTITNEQLRAAGTESDRLVNYSIKEFDAEVDKIKHARTAAEAMVAINDFNHRFRTEVDFDRRLEIAHGLKPGEAKNWKAAIMQIDPKMMAPLYQVAFSGEAADPILYAEALRYAPQSTSDAAHTKIGETVKIANKDFMAELAAKGIDEQAYSRLPTEQQTSLRKQSFATHPSITNSHMTNTPMRDIQALKVKNARDGVIPIPAILYKGKVVENARILTLLPEGEMGELAANLNSGDAADLFSIAASRVAEGSAKPTTIARELFAVINNAVVVEQAFEGGARKNHGLPPASTFYKMVKVPNSFTGRLEEVKVNLNSPVDLISKLLQVQNAAAKLRLGRVTPAPNFPGAPQ